MRLSSGHFRKRKIGIPKSSSCVRPTTAKLRMQVCNICQYMLDGARVLDIFAGTGAVGLEMLGRGAQSCVFVEQDRNVASTLFHTLEKLHVTSLCSVLTMSAEAAVRALASSDPFSIVYIDPPYAYEETPGFDDLLVFIDIHLPMQDGGLVFIEGKMGMKREFPLSSFSLNSYRRSGHSELYCYEKWKPVP